MLLPSLSLRKGNAATIIFWFWSQSDVSLPLTFHWPEQTARAFLTSQETEKCNPIMCWKEMLAVGRTNGVSPKNKWERHQKVLKENRGSCQKRKLVFLSLDCQFLLSSPAVEIVEHGSKSGLRKTRSMFPGEREGLNPVTDPLLHPHSLKAEGRLELSSMAEVGAGQLGKEGALPLRTRQEPCTTTGMSHL